MAYTVSSVHSVHGNDRTVHLDITADAATQTIETGLSRIYAHSVGAQSLSTGAIKVYANSNASGVQSMGVLGISGCAAGDEFYVTVFGAS